LLVGVAADMAAAADMAEVVVVSTEEAVAFMVEALPAVDFAEAALVSRAAAIEGADMAAATAEVTGVMAAATATAAMVVGTADTGTTVTDQAL
jgi:hypothetical protein